MKRLYGSLEEILLFTEASQFALEVDYFVFELAEISLGFHHVQWVFIRFSVWE